MKKKMRFGVPFAIVAGTLAIASIAWACTPQNGWTRLTNPDCPATSCSIDDGEILKAYATDVETIALANLYTLYLSVEPWCHPSSQNKAISGPHSPDVSTKRMPASGVAQGTIPNRTRGEFDVCFNNDNGTMGTSSNSTYPIIINVT